MHSWSLLATLTILSTVLAAPSPSEVSSAPAASPTVPYASDDPNNPLWSPESNITPEPIRGQLGATILGPQNVPLELENPDLLAPPSTDNGHVYDLGSSLSRVLFIPS